jgi:BirA family transcriptional regulator, biotin operon repressor / biotin---[acetyl-CoA-carboxylase] ligase
VGPRWDVVLLPESPSTNAEVARRARAGAGEGLVVVADHQTAGRGRLDRTWVTPARAALTFSVVLAPDVAAARWPWLPLLTGVAVVEGVRRSLGTACSLKWPNDVLADGLKVAGILVERVETDHGPVAVVGVGLNVSQTPAELPVETATALAVAAGTEPDRAALLGHLLAALGDGYDAWRSAEGDPSALRSTYLQVCSTVGSQVRVQLPGGGTLEGTATGVDPEGRLEVVDAVGRRTVLGAGDVVHVRPRG